MKKVIAAGIVRILEFNSLQEAANYTSKLDRKKERYKIIALKKAKDDKHRMKIITSYNSSPLIEAVEEYG